MLGGLIQPLNESIREKVRFSKQSSLAAPSFTKRKRKGKHMRDCSVPVMSPSSYLALALKNKQIKSRIGPFSVEQAEYFEPYREGEISTELLKAVRMNDLKAMQGFEAERLLERNIFGESLLHIACRLGLKSVNYLIMEARLPLNVQDKFGRSAMHSACLAAKPNFENIMLLLDRAPRLATFEDAKGKTPFDYIQPRNHGRWSRFLSEEGVLKLLQRKLKEDEKCTCTMVSLTGDDNVCTFHVEALPS